MEPKFTEKESLSLINEMIAQARNNFQKGAGTSFIFYGYMVAFTALLNVVLLQVLPNPYLSFHVWWLMAPAGFVNRCIEKKLRSQAMLKTHIDSIIKTTWRGFAFAVVLLLIVIFGYGIAQKNHLLFVLITPMIMIMTGIAEYVTAKACRFKPVETGAYILWAGALACLASYVFCSCCSGIIQFFILALCMILAFVVPGYKMNKMAKEHV
ncbi:MAG: hypothetical protein FWH23_08580 [Bacteroidales bacterium]|nr:hypothetical protein [Bacteroidales bacterium]MCL2133882.1 hypothetical protein [Bacteroidales bacterium]